LSFNDKINASTLMQISAIAGPNADAAFELRGHSRPVASTITSVFRATRNLLTGANR
jgi:hypothetical protein